MNLYRETIKDNIKNFLQNDPFYSEVVPKKIDDQYDLLDSGILDSIGVLNFIIFLENNFGISVEIEELNENNFQNIDKIADFVMLRSSKN